MAHFYNNPRTVTTVDLTFTCLTPGPSSKLDPTLDMELLIRDNE